MMRWGPEKRGSRPATRKFVLRKLISNEPEWTVALWNGVEWNIDRFDEVSARHEFDLQTRLLPQLPGRLTGPGVVIEHKVLTTS